MSDLLYPLALTFIDGIGDVLARQLVAYLGSPEKVFHTGKTRLMKVPGIGEKAAQSIINGQALKKAERELRFLQKRSILALFYLDEAYPRRLQHCADGPILLYHEGNTDLNAARSISIVGTRNATEYGREWVRQLLAELPTESLLIVSGLAYGIDSCAHQEAVKRGIPTLGVLGHGLHTIYPDANRSLSRKMLLNGGLITEYSSQHPMLPSNFATRNRIIAGLSDAVIVVETAVRGGAVITAQLANGYHRDVFALPGSTKEKYSSGCHFLIKTNRAALIESAADLMEAMNWDQNPKAKHKQSLLLLDLPEKQQKILECLRESGELTIDELVQKMASSQGELAADLLELELIHAIEIRPGKRYRPM